MLHHLGILFYDLEEHREHDLRDQHLCIADAAGVASVGHCSDGAQERANLLILEEFVPLHDVHICESGNDSCGHSIYLPCLFSALVNRSLLLFLGFVSLCLLFGRELAFHLGNLALKVCDRAVIGFLVCGQCLDLCLNGCSLFICAFLGNLSERRLQLRLACLEFFSFCSQVFQLSFLGVNLFPEHERFQCHLLFLLSIL